MNSGKSSIKTTRKRKIVPDSLADNTSTTASADASTDVSADVSADVSSGVAVEGPHQKRQRTKVDWSNTMPSKTFVRQQNKYVHEVLALKSIGEAVSTDN